MTEPSEPLKNPIAEYLKHEGAKSSRGSELFRGNDDFIDQMTELEDSEVKNALTLTMNDHVFMKRGVIGTPVYDRYLHSFMRFMVSKDRKSRGEFVEVQRAEVIAERSQNVVPMAGGVTGRL
jgi:hypothetical protein